MEQPQITDCKLNVPASAYAEQYHRWAAFLATFTPYYALVFTDDEVIQLAELRMDFDEYLCLKKIDPAPFRSAEPVRYAEWKRLFGQLSADSFTAQKKFLLNNTRRLYLLR